MVLLFLQVIGPGRLHKFKIGQRSRLSDLDLAQLRSMYYCNSKDRENQVNKLGKRRQRVERKREIEREREREREIWRNGADRVNGQLGISNRDQVWWLCLKEVDINRRGSERDRRVWMVVGRGRNQGIIQNR